MNRVIVGLFGPAGVGKDTVADAIGWPKASFAGTMKRLLQPLWDSAGIDINNREQKEKVRPIMIETGRCLRALNPHHWVKNIALPPGDGPVVITDVRYLNECQWVWANGGLVVELVRYGVRPANDEEVRSFGEIHGWCLQMGVTIPVVGNDGKPSDAAQQVFKLIDKRYHALDYEL